MKSFLLFACLGIACCACSPPAPVSDKPDTKDSLATLQAAAMDTGFKAYSGTIPCGDCKGLSIDLQLRDAFRLESYHYILRETHRGASTSTVKTIESRGFYNFWRGNDKDPDATIIVLNDDSTEDKKHFFMRLSDTALQVVDHQGNEFQHPQEYTLHRK